ncbi:biotin/lipoyl-containing protein [Bradyrhizobium sp. BWA-3-5]|uniref:biotin/lipoyl-containing protein n=1 Tax=Bradyrhizobium sp. BWA-3-5 TaxID=3080013 RepID=UPI00293F2A13|nr:biotin/lipoyl-containing protein [Bradyrhizobium sp. BWA-3-5]WOH63751.1 biotin/lipoyl-containing protein [Bradyrhizobium sp. BWA-3-5]
MNFSPADLEILAAHMQATQIDVVEIASGGRTLKLTGMGVSSRGHPEPSSPTISPAQVSAERPGVFLRRHPVRPASEICAGADVKAGEVLGYIAAAALLFVVRAPKCGLIGRILANDGDIVGYGNLLFEIV